ncbi:hypothetical protein [Arthrobacter globiformis]|uniref:hypothetical protein n=1 Tax=Arthrobacter globiformis TaxID=1665 RepID=UPI000B409DD7|nr:hypothetical protein [Arthrobacter globiformis]
MSTIAEYLQELQILTRDYRNAVQEAQLHTDDHLTPEGLQAKRAKLVQQAAANHQGKLAKLRSNFKIEADWLESRAQRAIPKPEGSTRDSWERVKMLLDSGQSLQTVIAKADAGSLHAVREWAPTYLDAMSKGANTDLRPFERSIGQRWAEILPEGEHVREYLDAAGDVAQFEHMANSLSDSFEGRAPQFGSLQDAFAAKYAAQTATADLSVIEARSHQATNA